MTSLREIVCAVAASVLFAPLAARAQIFDFNADHVGGMMRPESGRPAFELAVIRESRPGAEFRFNGIGMLPNRMMVTGTTLRDMVAFAYAVPDGTQLVGPPGWFSTQRFDVTAQPRDTEIVALGRLSAANLHDAMRWRLQMLLEERFGIEPHFGQRRLPLLVLLQTRDGLKCKRMTETTAAAFDNLPPPPPPPDRHLAGEEETVHWAFPSLPFPLIVSWISQQPEVGGRSVVDRTGLSGGFRCEMTWSHESANPTESSFFTALREQMGLRLQPERGPLDLLVVDRVKQPSEN